MKSTASSPGKVILFGEHFVVYGVRAILCAIDKRITATSRLIDERKIRILSSIGTAEMDLARDSPQGIQPGFMAPFLHIAQEVLKEYNEERGIEVVLESEIPAGVGLGSSSAACVAAAASATGLYERKSKEEILRKALEAERKIFEDASGADSSISAFGGLMAYSKDRQERIEFKGDLSLIIANSRQVHSTRELVMKVREFKSKNEKLFGDLCSTEGTLVDDALKALGRNDLRALGQLMSKNQEMLERIGVSTKVLNDLVREADKISYGSKMTGAGGGGCIIALVDRTNAATTLEHMKKLGDCFTAKIDFEGLSYL